MSAIENSIFFGWPAKAILSIYTDGNLMVRNKKANEFDLSDAIALASHNRFPSQVHFGIRSPCKTFESWDADTIEKCESNIRYDLAFDAYSVKINRVKTFDLKRNDEAIWELQIDVLS